MRVDECAILPAPQCSTQDGAIDPPISANVPAGRDVAGARADTLPAMDKSHFASDTRCTLVLRDAAGKSRPANVYVYRAYDAFLVVRAQGEDGLVRKIPYEAVERIVSSVEVAPAGRYALPAAMLDEKTWRDRASMQHYASSPGRGK